MLNFVVMRRRSSSPCSCRLVSMRRSLSTRISSLCLYLWMFEEELLIVLIFDDLVKEEFLLVLDLVLVLVLVDL